MTLRPTYSLKDLADILARQAEARVDPNDPTLPYYCVLLYTPGNGLDGRLHDYIRSRWDLMNTLTGDACLLLALEDVNRQPSDTEYRAEDVYIIGRKLGASVDAVPCMIF